MCSWPTHQHCHPRTEHMKAMVAPNCANPLRNAPKRLKIAQNRSKSAKFACQQHFPGEFAPYSDTWWLQVCLMAINLPTLLSTVSGSVINNQHQQLVEVKTTYSAVLIPAPPFQRRSTAAPNNVRKTSSSSDDLLLLLGRQL